MSSSNKIKKVDYNIEYAHIFADMSRFTLEQEQSLEVIRELIKKLEKQKKTYVLNVLIDDYSPSYSYLDVGHFLFKLREKGFPPNYVGYESRLLSVAELILKLVPKENKEIKRIEKEVSISKDVTFFLPPRKNFDEIGLKEESYFKHEEWYDTSILIAAWYLFRLGVVNAPDVIRRAVFTKSKPFIGKEIINILPKKYKKGVEKKVKDLLKTTVFAPKIKNINYKFY